MPLSTNTVSLTSLHPVAQGFTLPKIGTLIPNRIFVGGISSNTTEEELRNFFSAFGAIRDVKVIYDKSGLSKGSYGFVTFEDQHTAESIIKNEAESLIFKDRKLNIGYAVRKQHVFQKHELGSTLVVTHNGCSLGNGLSLVQLCPHDHPIIAMHNQPTFCYPTSSMIPSNVSNNPACPVASSSDSQQAYVNQHNASSSITPTTAYYNNPFFSRNLPLTTNVSKTEQPMSKPEALILNPTNDLSVPTAMIVSPNGCTSSSTSHPVFYRTGPCEINHCQWSRGDARLSYPSVLQQAMIIRHPTNSNDTAPLDTTGFSNTLEQKPTARTDTTAAPLAPQEYFRKVELHGIPSTCGCKTSHCATCYESQFVAPMSCTQCGAQRSFSSQHQAKEITHETEKIMPWAHSASSNLLHRILHSYSSETKSPNTCTAFTPVKPTSGTHVIQCAGTVQEFGPHEFHRTNPDRSFLRTSSSTTTELSLSPGTSSCQIPSPSHTSTPRSAGNELVINFDEQLKKSQQLDKDTSNMNSSFYRGESCAKNTEFTCPSDFWLDPFRNADVLNTRRLFGINLTQQSGLNDAVDRSEPKVTTPILTSGSTTSACGDISKHRPEQA